VNDSVMTAKLARVIAMTSDPGMLVKATAVYGYSTSFQKLAEHGSQLVRRV
jgi:hypothetical protein